MIFSNRYQLLLRLIRKHVIDVLIPASVFIFWYYYISPEPISNPYATAAGTGDAVLALSYMKWWATCFTDVNLHCNTFPHFISSPNTMFLTESFMFLSVFLHVSTYLSSNYLVQYNFVCIFVIIINYACMYLALRRLAKASPTICSCAAIFASAQPLFVNNLEHIHLLPIFPIPLCLLCIYQSYRSRHFYWFYLFYIFLFLLLVSGLSLFLMFVITLFLLFISYIYISVLDLISYCKHVFWNLHHFFALLFFFALSQYFFYNYFLTSAFYSTSRNLDENQTFSISFSDIASMLGSIYLFTTVTVNKAYFLGLTCIIFILLTPLVAKLVASEACRGMPRAAYFVMVLSAGLTLGPSLSFSTSSMKIPFLYTFLWHIFPIVRLMRVPSRFAILAVICCSFLMAFVLNIFYTKFELLFYSTTRQYFFTLITIILFLILTVGGLIFDLQPKRTYDAPIVLTPLPRGYLELDPADAPILELPMWPPDQTFIQYQFWLQHRMARIGGISSFFPQAFFDLKSQLDSCPSQSCFDSIISSKANSLIIDHSASTTADISSTFADNWRVYPFFSNRDGTFVATFTDEINTVFRRSRNNSADVIANQQNLRPITYNLISERPRGQVCGMSGWSRPETFGRWTDTHQSLPSRLDFCRQLPRTFTMTLGGGAFGPNTTKPTTIFYGDWTGQVQFRAEHDFYTMTVNSTYRSNVISLMVPKPISPAALGLSGDSRNLGIFLSTILVAYD